MWKKLSSEEIKARVFEALGQNINFEKSSIIGLPASYLDPKVFNKDAPFLKDAPYLSAMIQNPNHIGCHTLGTSEPFFSGTQDLERELIRICAEDILKGGENGQDGYVASGGTEANMQAAWVYRNYFRKEHQAESDEVLVLCSQDCHYSLPKAANILGLQFEQVPVDENSRQVLKDELEKIIRKKKDEGVKALIIVANMMTTMFGSVDDISVYANAAKQAGLPYRIHVDGAYGGFVYPFSTENSEIDFSNPEITSVTLDAHKMGQAPYGTGIFLIRKGYMQNVQTESASYVQGLDSTLIGSRSGANAIAVWMILMTYGPNSWHEKIHILMYRTNWLCSHLTDMGIAFYRHPSSNIITIKASEIPEELTKKYGLVPDNHQQPKWYKIVVMEHVSVDKLELFLEDLRGI